MLHKIREEADEIEAALDRGDAEELAAETGDLLFALVNLARHVGADPEFALRGTNAKFERRFAYIERALAAKGRSLEGASFAEMDALWNEAKGAERPVTSPQAKHEPVSIPRKLAIRHVAYTGTIALPVAMGSMFSCAIAYQADGRHATRGTASKRSPRYRAWSRRPAPSCRTGLHAVPW